MRDANRYSIQATRDAHADELALLISQGDLPDQVRRRKQWSKRHLARLLDILKERSKQQPIDGHTAFKAYANLQTPGIRRLQAMLANADLKQQTDPDYGTEIHTTEEWVNPQVSVKLDESTELDEDTPPSDPSIPQLKSRTIKRVKDSFYGGLNPNAYMQAIRDLAGYAKDWVDLAVRLGVVDPTVHTPPAQQTSQSQAITQINQINLDLRKTLIQAVQSGDTSMLEQLARGTPVIDQPPQPTQSP